MRKCILVWNQESWFQSIDEEGLEQVQGTLFICVNSSSIHTYAALFVRLWYKIPTNKSLLRHEKKKSEDGLDTFAKYRAQHMF